LVENCVASHYNCPERLFLTLRLLMKIVSRIAGISLIAFAIFSAQTAKADTLRSWRFASGQNQLEFTTDEGVQPTAMLLANPSRLVIDLPGIRLGRPKINQPLNGAVKAVRIGQFDATTTRIVVELATGYTVDPQSVKVRGISPTRWTVQLPTPTFNAAVMIDENSDRAVQSGIVITPIAPPSQPASRPSISRPSIFSQPIPNSAIATGPISGDTFGGLVPSGRALNWLQQRVADLRSQSYRALNPGIFFLDLETGNYLSLGGDKVLSTASIIKLPILIALFQDVDAGKISLDETLVMTRDLIVGGSGEMQDRPVNSKFSVLETANKMITISDNTATNLIIKRMGGIQVLNQRFRSWGLQKTAMRNWLPDLRGTNTTTARELVKLLAMLDKQQLLSSRSQAQALDILRRVKNRKLLPRGLGQGATIAHKTGDIGFLLGDTGIIEMPTGKRYLAAVLVESPYDDPKAVDFIQDVSRMVYTYLTQPSTVSVETR
jgi:beta-lactamase class A